MVTSLWPRFWPTLYIQVEKPLNKRKFILLAVYKLQPSDQEPWDTAPFESEEPRRATRQQAVANGYREVNLERSVRLFSLYVG